MCTEANEVGVKVTLPIKAGADLASVLADNAEPMADCLPSHLHAILDGTLPPTGVACNSGGAGGESRHPFGSLLTRAHCPMYGHDEGNCE